MCRTLWFIIVVNHNICLLVGDVQFTVTIHTKFPTTVTYTNHKNVVKPEKLISKYFRPQKCMCRTLWFMIVVNHNICLLVGDVQFTVTIHTKFPTTVTYTNLKDVVKPEKLITKYFRPQKCMCRTLWFMIVVNHNICLLIGDVQFTVTIHTKFPTTVTYTNLTDVVKPEKLISKYFRPQKCLCRTLWFMIVVNHNICLLVGDVQFTVVCAAYCILVFGVG